MSSVYRVFEERDDSTMVWLALSEIESIRQHSMGFWSIRTKSGDSWDVDKEEGRYIVDLWIDYLKDHENRLNVGWGERVE